MAEDAVEELIREHLERRPLMWAVDVYKLLYQGVFGVGHILGEHAWHRLKEEARALRLGDQPEEPLMEAVSSDGAMVRVNLRPYLRRGFPLEKLFSAMKASSVEKRRVEEFIEVWRAFKEFVRTGRLVFDEGEIEALDREMRPGACPPRHHSEVYRRAYAPAYRVVKRGVLERIFGADELGV